MVTREKYPHRILIVEDENAILKTLVDNLEAAGFGHILEARNGEEGLKIALSEKPDLILLDIIMPKIDGMAMLRKLRQNPAGKDLKVIFLTNLMADDSITKEIAKGEPSYYLVKTDHSINEVIEKVKTVLGIEEKKGK